MQKRAQAEIPNQWDQDENERFLVGRCALYLLRHVSGRGMENRSTVEFLYQTLGEGMAAVETGLSEKLSAHLKREMIEGLKDCDDDMDDRARVLMRILKKAPRTVAKAVQEQVVVLLEQRVTALDTGGGSFIERNLDQVREMFHLDDAEAEFCTFLFVLSTCEAAESFFVRELGCNQFINRKHLCRILGRSPQELQNIISGTLARIDAIDMDSFDLRLKDDYLKLIINPATASLASAFFTPVISDSIPLDRHFNLKKETQCVLGLLREKPRDSSTHILIYGPPGQSTWPCVRPSKPLPLRRTSCNGRWGCSWMRTRFAFHDPEELTHEALVAALREEMRLKKLHGNEKSIGFQ